MRDQKLASDMRGVQDQSPYNIVTLGDVKSGKTTLVMQCINGTMRNVYKPTIEDCYRTLARLPDGKYKTVNMVDTAGSMEFPAMRELRIRSATAVVIIYDTSSQTSIDMVATHKKQVQQIREYDGVPIIVIGNLKGQKKNMLHYQIPAGVMEDSTCEHFYIDLSDSAQCKRVFDKTIEKCYNSSTWKVEVWAMAPNQTKQNQLQKKRGILSFFSLRHRKKKKATTKNMAQSKSLP